MRIAVRDPITLAGEAEAEAAALEEAMREAQAGLAAGLAALEHGRRPYPPCPQHEVGRHLELLWRRWYAVLKEDAVGPHLHQPGLDPEIDALRFEVIRRERPRPFAKRGE